MRPDEQAVAAGAFLTLLGFTAGHALLETARDALFLGRLPATRLPWVYLAIAMLALLLAGQQRRIFSRFPPRHELSGWLVVAAAGTTGIWLALRTGATWSFYALYVWTGVLATLVVVRFWTHLSGSFTVTQAKRVYAVIAAGSVLGAILGTAAARVLVSWFPARALVPAASAVFLLASPAPRWIGSRGRMRNAAQAGMALGPREIEETVRTIWGRPYLRRVAVLILTSTVTFTLVDFVFKTTVDRSIAPADLGAFFATTYLVLNLLSLVVQFAGVGWLFRHLGVNRALAVVPALVVGASVGMAAFGGVAVALVLKGVDGSLRHSLSRTGTELLFVAMPSELLSRVKPVIDTLGQRGGQAVASLLILALLGFTARETAFALLVVLSGSVWLFLVLDLRSHYVDLFRTSLDEEVKTVRYGLPVLDEAGEPRLEEALASADPREVATALDILEAQDRSDRIPGGPFRHRDPRVVERAVRQAAAASRPPESLAAGLADLLMHPDPGVREAATLAAIRLGSPALPDESAAAPGDRVQELARVGRIVLEATAGDTRFPAEAVARLAAAPPGVVAEAIAARPSEAGDEYLVAALRSPEPRARAAAVRALGRREAIDHAPALIPLLAERAIRREVRGALVRMGPGAIDPLRLALADPKVPLEVRRQIPEAIGRFGIPLGADMLTGRLSSEPDGMIRFKLLRALGKMRRRNPALPLDLGAIRRAQLNTEARATRLLEWRRALEVPGAAPPGSDPAVRALLIELLRDKQRHAVERLFRMLNLESSNDDFFRVHRGFERGEPRTVAHSRELLEHLIPARRRPALYRLVADLFDPDLAPAAGSGVPRMDPRAALREMITVHADTLGILAAHLLGERTSDDAETPSDAGP